MKNGQHKQLEKALLFLKELVDVGIYKWQDYDLDKKNTKQLIEFANDLQEAGRIAHTTAKYGGGSPEAGDLPPQEFIDWSKREYYE